MRVWAQAARLLLAASRQVRWHCGATRGVRGPGLLGGSVHTAGLPRLLRLLLQASGFCYVNDCVLGILELLKYHAR